MAEAPLAFGFADTAKMLGISRGSLYRLVDRGDVKSFSLLGRRLVSRSEIERIVSGNDRPSPPVEPQPGKRKRGRPRKVRVPA